MGNETCGKCYSFSETHYTKDEKIICATPEQKQELQNALNKIVTLKNIVERTAVLIMCPCVIEYSGLEQ